MTAVPENVAEPTRTGLRRDPAIDVLRALAALAVLVTHAGDAAGTPGWHHDVLGIGTFRTGLAIQQMNVGVDVFFVLSAFLVYRPFVAAHLDAGPPASIARYSIRRAARVFPAYLVALWLIVALSADRTLPSAGTFLANSLLVQGWRIQWTGSDVGLRQAWTLTVEVAFYALVPLFVVGVRALGRRVGALRAEVTGACALLVLGPLTLWWLQRHPLDGFVPLPLPYVGVFAWGMLLAVADVARPRVHLRVPWAWWWAAGVAVFLVFVQTTTIDALETYRLSANSQLLERVVHGVIALLVVAPVALPWLGRGRLLTWQPLAAVGLFSYGFYLWHYFFLDVLRDHVATDGDFLLVRLFVPTAVLATVAGALSWYLIEQPALRSTTRSRSRPRP